MTLLVSWLGVDTHGPCSAYIAADSRISWGARTKYDYGRKVFALKNSPDILGYCGDVLFPLMVLSQIVDMADSGLLFPMDAPCDVKFKAIKQKLRYRFENYPYETKGITQNTVVIIHASRNPTLKNGFEVNMLYWTEAGGWHDTKMKLPATSSVLCVQGTGAKDFTPKYQTYGSGPNKDTSRNVFHCFCDSLFNTSQETVGGAPQLVGIYRKPKSNGFNRGIIVGGQRYYLGAKVNELLNFDRVAWTNERFENCDGVTGKRKLDARSRPARPTR